MTKWLKVVGQQNLKRIENIERNDTCKRDANFNNKNWMLSIFKIIKFY